MSESVTALANLMGNADISRKSNVTQKSMDWTKFKTCAEEFVEKSKSLCDGWKLIEGGTNPGETYLAKKFIRLPKTEEFDKELIQKDTNYGSYQYLSCKTPSPKMYEYHVVFNPSYSVPVLYYNIYDLAGKRLPDSVNISEVKMESVTVSQVEHPITHKPFYMVHPCSTSELITSVSCPNELIMWMSSLSQIMHFELAQEYMESEKSLTTW